MDKVNSFLVDWSIRFLENKDAIKKEIVNIEKNKEGFDFVVHYKDKAKYFIITPMLENNIFSRIKNDGHFGIFTLNNMANIRFVVSEWRKLIDFKFLSIYFINPFSNLDKVWTVYPYTHSKICDKSSLGLGLRSMAEMVDMIDIKGLSKKVKLLREESDL